MSERNPFPVDPDYWGAEAIPFVPVVVETIPIMDENGFVAITAEHRPLLPLFPPAASREANDENPPVSGDAGNHQESQHE